jgi:hypothetical protein
MKRAICEITGESFDCKNCKIKDDCAYIELDNAIAHLMKQIRESVTEALSENTTSK